MADDLILYGTPFPTIENESKDYVPIWKQKAVSSKGTKRLHGAFEGGFSAGYHNTVGSKEGWKPAEFVSSRDKRIGDVADFSKPEYFMDEEDLSELSVKKLVFIKDVLDENYFSPDQSKTVPREKEVSEAFSGGGVWDDTDDSVVDYDKTLNLHLIGESIDSKPEIMDERLILDFGDAISLETDIPVQDRFAPPDFIPKLISASFSGKNLNCGTKEEVKSEIHDAETSSRLKQLDEKTASSALKGFIPFGEDLDKQQRYVNYLRFCIKGQNDSSRPASSNIYINDTEKEEFIMSAQIFKPSSALIASRFQSSSAPSAPNSFALKPGLSRPETKSLKPPGVDLLSSPDSKISTNLNIHAGPGRTEFIWIPNSLLCKRFNVEPPKSGPAESTEHRKPKQLLGSGEVDRIVDNFMKESKRGSINESFDSEPVESDFPAIATDDIFEEIFGAIESSPTVNQMRPRAVDYFD